MHSTKHGVITSSMLSPHLVYSVGFSRKFRRNNAKDLFLCQSGPHRHGGQWLWKCLFRNEYCSHCRNSHYFYPENQQKSILSITKCPCCCVTYQETTWEQRIFAIMDGCIMDALWGSCTRKQYECYLSKWELSCCERKIDPFSPSLEDGINFWGKLYDQGI